MASYADFINLWVIIRWADISRYGADTSTSKYLIDVLDLLQGNILVDLELYNIFVEKIVHFIIG